MIKEVVILDGSPVVCMPPPTERTIFVHDGMEFDGEIGSITVADPPEITDSDREPVSQWLHENFINNASYAIVDSIDQIIVASSAPPDEPILRDAK